MIAHINIGSNLGHRADMLSRAVTLLTQEVGTVTAVSEPIETQPFGYESPNSFLNIGVNVETERSPQEIVELLKKIENTIAPDGRHRDRSGNYCDRKIDLDLICMGSIVSTDPRATIPHPGLTERDFVLVPLSELLPEWHHPQINLTPSEILKRLTETKQ